jgi:hypothetical protein
MAGEIISEQRATSNRNGARDHPGIPGDFRRNQQRVAIAVSSHGQITGYFVGPDEYEEFRRFRENRQSFATPELPEEKVEAIRASRMDTRHAHLDAMLDPK